MSEKKTCLQLLQRFLQADLVQRDVSAALSCLSRNIWWFGTSDSEDVHGLQEARQYIEQEISCSNAPYLVEYLECNDQTQPDGSGATQVKCLVTGNGVVMHCRCSAAVCIEDGRPKLCALHLSVPDTVQQDGEYFPFSLAQQYEKELHDEFFDELIDGGVLGRYYEPSTEIFVVNRQLLDFLGYPSEEVFRAELHNSAANTIFPPDREAGFATLQQQLAHNNRYRMEYRMLRRDGTPVWVETHGKMVTTREGRTALVGIVNDISARKETERKLRESEQLYRIAIDGANVQVWEYDIRSHKIVLAQTAHENLAEGFLGDGSPEAIMDKVGISAQQAQELQALFRRMEAGEARVCADFWSNNPVTNSRRCEHVTYSVEFDENGKPLKAYGAGIDITQSKLLEKRYQEELVYRNSVAESVVSSCCVDLFTQSIEVMRTADKDTVQQPCGTLTDYRGHVRLFVKDCGMTDAQNRRLSPAGLIRCYDSGETKISEEFPVCFAKGHYGWMRTDVNLVKHPDTEHILAFFYNYDVTDPFVRTLVMDTLLAKYYEEVGTVDLRTGIYKKLAADGALTKAENETEYAKGVERFCQSRVARQDRQRMHALLQPECIRQTLLSEGLCELQYLGISLSGQERYAMIRLQYLADSRDILVLTRQDVDQLVRTQQEKQQLLEQAVADAKQANRIKSEFLSRMSHEIRTPLGAIIGLAELGKANLQKPLPDRAEGLDYVTKTLDSSHYLLSLINDILDMSKIENGEIALVPQPMDCAHILNSIRTIIDTQAKAKHICFEILQKTGCPQHVVGDATRVEQVLINLLGNAVKFTPQDGQVQLTIELQARFETAVTMRFTVSDTGVGISPEFLPRVFDPFAQEYAGITSVYGGSGLGLSIARQLTRMMHGDLTVESKKGEGSVFTAVMQFALPEEADAAGEASTEKDGAQVDLSGLQLLVCEDYPLNIMVVTRLLEQRGCKVTVAQNGRLGVQTFAQSTRGFFDAVLMDIRMPEMDGLSATRAIRQMDRPDAKTVPVIAMTANAYEEDIRLSLQAGMNMHLSKPIEPRKLYEAIGLLTGRLGSAARSPAPLNKPV